MLLTLLLVAAAAYGVIVALLFFGQCGLLYLPAHTRVSAQSTDFELQRPDVVLRGWQVNPGRQRVILYFGGNGEAIEYNQAMFASHCPRSSTYLLAYRGYGASGGKPRSADIRADALALFDEVRRQHPDAPIAVVGRSLGSGVAAWVAAHRPVSRIALVTPYQRMRDVAAHHYPWLPVRWLLREQYDSIDWLQGVDAPILVIRASHDDVVPAASTDALLAGLPRESRSVTLQGMHNMLGEDYPRVLCDFMEPASP